MLSVKATSPDAALKRGWSVGGVTMLLLIAGATLGAQDWPHFLGPQRDGQYLGSPLARTWPGGAPRELWRRPVGEGFAGPVVSGGRVLLFHRVRGREVLEALDAETGAPIWRYDYPTTYRDDFGFDEGPRSAPVVAGGRVYTFGAQGQLHAVDLDTGAARLERRHARALPLPQGVLRSGRLAAGRGRTRDRQRRGSGRRHSGLRRRFGRRCSGPWPARRPATRRRWGLRLRWRPARAVLYARQPGEPRPRRAEGNAFAAVGEPESAPR